MFVAVPGVMKVGRAFKAGMLGGRGPQPRRVLRAMLYGKDPFTLSTPASRSA